MKKQKKQPQPSDIVDVALSMPITYAEQCQFNAIKQMVFADTFLREGYRTPKQVRKSRYLEPLKSVTAMIEKARSAVAAKRENKPKRMARKVWTPALIAEFVALYPQTPNLEICKILDLTLHQVHDKAHVLGLRKDSAYLAALARQRLFNSRYK